MRRLTAAALAIVGLGSVAMAARIGTLRSTAKVYPNEIRRVFETPSATLPKGEVVEVLRNSSSNTALVKIRTRSGREGWIEAIRLDTNERPPILGLTPVSAPAAPALTPKDDSVVLKRWMEANKGGSATANPGTAKVDSAVAPKAEKTVDFPASAPHITERSGTDSAAAKPAPNP